MDDLVKRELIALAASAPQGLLKPEQVLEFAKSNPESALHSEFEWNDAEAANQFRVQQARELIRVYVTVLPQTLQRVRGFLSVPSDRANGGGYRQTEDVLKNDVLRQQMIEDTLKRIESLRKSATYLPELQPLFAELFAVVANFRAARLTKVA